VLDVNSGQVKLGRESSVLRSLAIGSCVAVVAYDRRQKVGAMAHVMLPGKARPSAAEKTRYAADALEHLSAIMTRAGSRLDDADVCLVGAGNVLERLDDTICAANIRSIRGILGQMRIPIRAAVLGGTERKGVCLCVRTGRVSHTVGDSEDRILWELRPVRVGEAACGDPCDGQRYD
jgi:chemotaxis protein CheD